MHLTMGTNPHFLAGLFGILVMVCCSTAFPTIRAPTLNFSTLDTVPGTASLENIAIRQTGDILVTSVSINVLYQISGSNNTGPAVVASIPDVFGLLRIVELEVDVFYVVGSQISGVSATPGSNDVWRVNMREPCSCANETDSTRVAVSLVARIVDAKLLNGMSRLSEGDSAHLLISDSSEGVVYKLNVYTGAYEVVIRDPSVDTRPDGLGVGINGIHVYGHSLYFTNLDIGTFATIPICLDTGLATGLAKTIAEGIVSGDDFAIFQHGTKALIANNGEFTLTLVDIPGKSASIAVNSTILQASSAVAFGRTFDGLTSIYATSSIASDNSTVGSVVVAEW